MLVATNTRLKCFACRRAMSGKCLYTGNLSPFGQQHTLAKPFKMPVLEVAREYKLSNPQLVPGVGVSVFAADGEVATLGRLTKLSRHKDIQKKIATVLDEAGQSFKVKLSQLTPVPVQKEFLRSKNGEGWVKNLKTTAKYCLLAKVMVPEGAPSAIPATEPPSANPAPAPAPSGTPSAIPATEPPSANPAPAPSEPAPAPSTTPSQPSATRSVEVLPDSSAVRPSLPPSAQPPSASKSLYKSQRHGYDRIAVYMIV